MGNLLAKSLSHSVASILFCLTACSIAAAGLGGLKLNASYSAYFDPQDPILATHRMLKKRFSITDGFVVVLQFEASTALEDSSLEALHRVVTELELLDFVVGTTTIFDLRLTEEAQLAEFDLDFDSLDDEFEPSMKTAVPIVDKKSLRSDPRGQGLLISDNDNALAIDVSVDLPTSLPAPELMATMAKARSAVAQALSALQTPITVRYSGPLILNEAYVSVVKHDLRVFLPVLIISMGLVLSLIFGSWKLAGYILVIAGLAVLAAFGLAGWLGFELAAIVAFAPVIIATITIAGCVHLLNGYRDGLDKHQGKREALRNALRENLLPLSLTSLTTAGGFLTLWFSPSPPVRTIGYIVAFGVTSAWFLIMFALPAMLVESKATPARSLRLEQFLAAILRPAQKYPVPTLVFFSAIGLTLVPLVGKNQINDNVFSYFPADHVFQQDARFLENHFSGVNPTVYSVESHAPFGALDSQFVAAVAELQHYLEQQPEVQKTIGVTSFAPITAAQGNYTSLDFSRYKALAQIHTPRGLGIENIVDPNYRRVAVRTYTRSLDAQSQIAFDKRISSWWEKHYPDYAITSGGVALVFAHLGQRNALSMVTALASALVVISLICVLVLRSPHGVWIGLFCNLFPILVVYAMWALIDGNISIGGAVVIGMILGIVVDDTLYLLAGYQRAKRDPRVAPVTEAISKVGPAVLATSATLIVGLSAGLFSDFAPIKTMSGLSIAVIFVAVVTDLMVLSIVLQKLPRPKTIQMNNQ